MKHFHARKLRDRLITRARLQCNVDFGRLACFRFDVLSALVVAQERPEGGAERDDAVYEGVAGNRAFGEDLAVESRRAIEDGVGEDGVDPHETLVSV